MLRLRVGEADGKGGRWGRQWGGGGGAGRAGRQRARTETLPETLRRPGGVGGYHSLRISVAS